MIPVLLQPVPEGFDDHVRRKGLVFLEKHPNQKLNSADFKHHEYWTWASEALYKAYRGICAYSCVFIPCGTVDHYWPKTKPPYDKAYEWSNFRLAQDQMNRNKGNRCDVLDPFEVKPGWFALDFPDCHMKAGDGVPMEITTQVENTIKILKLNAETFKQHRCDVMLDFAKGEIDLAHMKRRYPFLATEIVRQGIESTAHLLFKQLPASNK